MHLDGFVFLCPKLSSALGEDVFTSTGEEAGRCFPPISGPFEVTLQPFRLVTSPWHRGPLPVARRAHRRLGNYLRIEVGVAHVFWRLGT